MKSRHLYSFADMLPAKFQSDMEGLIQDCSNSSALAMELLQSCSEPSICEHFN